MSSTLDIDLDYFGLIENPEQRLRESLINEARLPGLCGQATTPWQLAVVAPCPQPKAGGDSSS